MKLLDTVFSASAVAREPALSSSTKRNHRLKLDYKPCI